MNAVIPWDGKPISAPGSRSMSDFFERYADRIMPEPNSGCWLWIASQTTSGYGNFTRWNRTQYAHRSAFECANGDGAAAGIVVRHACDNPPCCNPDHLLGGTSAENVQDAWSRGRMRPARGEASPKATITELSVVQARSMAAAGTPICDVAKALGVAWKTIDAAVRGKTWGHLPGAVIKPAKKEVCPPHRRGSATNGAKLSEQQAAEIRRRARAGEPLRKIAGEFGIARATVSAIKVGRLWAHV